MGENTRKAPTMAQLRHIRDHAPILLARYKSALEAHVAAYDACAQDEGIQQRLKDAPDDEAVVLLGAASARACAFLAALDDVKTTERAIIAHAQKWGVDAEGNKE